MLFQQVVEKCWAALQLDDYNQDLDHIAHAQFEQNLHRHWPANVT